MLQAILFGVLQGLTEFFPVSSSGHLVLFKHAVPGMEKWGESIEFEVAVHLGTTIAVLAVFWRDALAICKDCWDFARARLTRSATEPSPTGQSAGLTMGLAIVIGTVPTGIIALLFKDQFERMFSSVGLVGVALAVTGTLLWATRWFDRANAARRPLSPLRAFIVGVAQGIAITPGISRSGSTISTGFFLRLDRETAGRFSFLLSVPAVLGACALKLRHGFSMEAGQMHELIAGTLAAAVVGYLCLRLLMPLIKRGRFYYFAY